MGVVLCTSSGDLLGSLFETDKCCLRDPTSGIVAADDIPHVTHIMDRNKIYMYHVS